MAALERSIMGYQLFREPLSEYGFGVLVSDVREDGIWGRGGLGERGGGLSVCIASHLIDV